MALCTHRERHGTWVEVEPCWGCPDLAACQRPEAARVRVLAKHARRREANQRLLQHGRERRGE